MMKVVSALFLATVIALFAADSAYACGGMFEAPCPSKIEIDNDYAHVNVVSKGYVHTGSVKQVGGSFVTATTGNVYKVDTVGLAQVNMTKLPDCACSQIVDINVDNKFASVNAVAKSYVGTGKVSQFSVGGAKVATTGEVKYVTTDSTAVVNYTDFTVTPVTP